MEKKEEKEKEEKIEDIVQNIINNQITEIKEETKKEKEEPKEPIRDSTKVKKNIPENKYTVINAPYQDNEDYLILETGFGKPVNFIPLQIETTSYKSWVLSSTLHKKNSQTFSYDKTASTTSEEPGDWDTVVDQAGTISGNILYDKLKKEIDNNSQAGPKDEDYERNANLFLFK